MAENFQFFFERGKLFQLLSFSLLKYFEEKSQKRFSEREVFRARTLATKSTVKAAMMEIYFSTRKQRISSFRSRCCASHIFPFRSSVKSACSKQTHRHLHVRFSWRVNFDFTYTHVQKSFLKKLQAFAFAVKIKSKREKSFWEFNWPLFVGSFFSSTSKFECGSFTRLDGSAIAGCITKPKLWNLSTSKAVKHLNS